MSDHTIDPAEYRGNDYALDDELDHDDGYREWAETIENQVMAEQVLIDYDRADSLITLDELVALHREELEANQMTVIDLSQLTWDEVMAKLTPGSHKPASKSE